MTGAMLLERIDALTTQNTKLASAVQQMASMLGTRLTRAQLCERMGIHRNTLRTRAAERSFPKPDASGKYLLSEVLEWERGNAG